MSLIDTIIKGAVFAAMYTLTTTGLVKGTAHAIDYVGRKDGNAFNFIKVSDEAKKNHPVEANQINQAIIDMQGTPEGKDLLNSLAKKTRGQALVLTVSNAGITNYKENIEYNSTNPASITNKYYGRAHINLGDLRQSDVNGKRQSIEGIVSGIVALGAAHNFDAATIKGVERHNAAVDKERRVNGGGDRYSRYTSAKVEINLMDGNVPVQLAPAIGKANDYIVKYNKFSAVLPSFVTMADKSFDNRTAGQVLQDAATKIVRGEDRVLERRDAVMVACIQKSGLPMSGVKEYRDTLGSMPWPDVVNKCKRGFEDAISDAEIRRDGELQTYKYPERKQPKLIIDVTKEM